MAATRFYFPAEGSGAPSVSPAFDPGWEQTGEATRLNLLLKNQLSTLSTIAANTTRNVPITTTQDILCNQFVSAPIPPVRLDTSCLFSLVISALESGANANVNLAVVVRVLSQDGGTIRGTVFSNFNLGTEFSLTSVTWIAAQTAVTALTTQPGDRIVVEIGVRATGPTSASTYTMRQGTSATTDFALTQGLSTDLNPWCEFSMDLFNLDNQNYKRFQSGPGNTGIISIGETLG